MAYNFAIQSPGADLTSRAFIIIARELKARGWGRGLFTIHDEVLVEVLEQHVAEAEKLIIDTMVSMSDDLLEIPLKAESSGGMDRWQD